MTSEGLQAHLASAGFRGKLQPECALAPYTTWRIGGPAELLATPADRDDLILGVRWARSHGIDWRVLGNGSNLLVRDQGVRGVVFRIRRVLDTIVHEGTEIRAGAGASFPAVARAAARAGLAGLEFGAGIPGTLGGAIIMNGGWHEYEIRHSVIRVHYLDAAGTESEVPVEECGFRYRGSRFRGAGGAVLGAVLGLKPDDPVQVQERMDRFAASRKENQPTELPSCGSVFLKPEGDFAGRLIEAAGLKGGLEGGVQVSPKHANFFVNVGDGTAADVLRLVEKVEREVKQQFGVNLVREFELW